MKRQRLKIGGNRKPNGQFAKGNRCSVGHGRPAGSGHKQLQELMERVVPAKRREKILDRLATAAERGDIRAAQLLFDRIYGKPHHAFAVTKDEHFEPDLRYL